MQNSSCRAAHSDLVDRRRLCLASGASPNVDLPSADTGDSVKRPFSLLIFCLGALGGCQSGRVGQAQFSDDGSVLAFRDAERDTVYVADGRCVQGAGTGDFLLSADGHLLLIIRRRPGTESSPGYRAADHLRLRETATARWHDTSLPFDIPTGLIPRYEVLRCAETKREAEPNPFRFLQETTEVFFGAGPTVTFGPIEDEYWCWSPQSGWHLTARPDAPGLDIAAQVRRGVKQRRWLVQLGPDGWNARRTVWVRPDGSTLELLRQNTVLARLCPLVLCSPVALIPIYGQFWALSLRAECDELAFNEAEDATVQELQRVMCQRRVENNK
jgi:hypothetical protein